MTDWPFTGLRRGAYGVVYADPPWGFLSYSGSLMTPHRHSSCEDHYRTMTFDELCDLPVSELAKPDAALFMWVVDSHLDVALALGKAWGFKYKTRAFEWLKSTKDGTGYRISMGYYTRKQCESCLLFTRGAPRRIEKGVRQIIEEPIRRHSQKPDETYRRIERLLPGPYCELFATQRWPGWEGWGHGYPNDTRRHLTSLIDGFRERIGAGSPEPGD